MPATPTQLVRSSLTTTATTYYTVPAGQTVVVSSIALCNDTAGATYVSLDFGGLRILGGVNLDAFSTTFIDNCRQVLTAGQVIRADAGTAVRLHISGTVIT